MILKQCVLSVYIEIVSFIAFYKRLHRIHFSFLSNLSFFVYFFIFCFFKKKCSFSNYKKEIKRNATLLCKVNPSGCLLHPIL